MRATSVRLAVEPSNERKGPRWAGAGGHHLLVQPSEIGLSVHVEPLRQKMEAEPEAPRLLKGQPEHLCRAPRDPFEKRGPGSAKAHEVVATVVARPQDEVRGIFLARALPQPHS